MPAYVVRSESPIEVRELSRPELPPGWEPPTVGGGPIIPPRPSLPPDWGRPELPPDFEFPEFPPGFRPPEGWRPDWKPSHPIYPVEPEEPGEPDPPEIWPPLRPELPGMPDMTGKTAILALLFVSRHAPVYRWVIIDHDEVKTKLEAFIAWLRSKLPAGGIIGRPPQRPTPG